VSTVSELRRRVKRRLKPLTSEQKNVNRGLPHGVKGEVRKMTMLNDTLPSPALIEGRRPSCTVEVDLTRLCLIIGMRLFEYSIS